MCVRKLRAVRVGKYLGKAHVFGYRRLSLEVEEVVLDSRYGVVIQLVDLACS
jgi:hypothetical protein